MGSIPPTRLPGRGVLFAFSLCALLQSDCRTIATKSDPPPSTIEKRIISGEGRDPAPMALVPEGSFLRGSEKRGEDDENPQRRIYLDSFLIDQFES